MPNPQPPATRKPVVLMTMGAQPRNGHAYQVMTHKYIMPLVEISGCVPLLVPTCCGTADLEQYLNLADGIYLSGAGSNIDPALYGQEKPHPGETARQGSRPVRSAPHQGGARPWLADPRYLPRNAGDQRGAGGRHPSEGL